MKVFVTGSADGLGRMAAELLLDQGHEVVQHARSKGRADQTRLPKASSIVVGDLSTLKEMYSVADQANKAGPFDAIIHNAGVGYQEPRRSTPDGCPHVFAINTLAPYVLTALIQKPKRLVYLSSGMHHGADTSLTDLLWTKRRWIGSEAYAETKFHDVVVAFAAARLFPTILSNAVEPGWVATKMGGPGAPDDLNAGYRTQVWLATSQDPAALVTGQYFYHQALRTPNLATRDVEIQDSLLAQCEKLSGVKFA